MRSKTRILPDAKGNSSRFDEGVTRRCVMWGRFDSNYTRNHIIQLGLRRLGWEVETADLDYEHFRAQYEQECGGMRAVLRAIRSNTRLLGTSFRARRSIAHSAFVYVPAFCVREVPLAAAFARFYRRPLVLDMLVSRLDVRVNDYRDVRRKSVKGLLYFFEEKAYCRLPHVRCFDTKVHQEYLEKRYAIRGPGAVVPVGFDDELLPDHLCAGVQHSPSDVCRFVYWGSLVPIHGVRTVLETAHLLESDRSIAITLVVHPKANIRTSFEREGGVPRNVKIRTCYADFDDLTTYDVALGIFGDFERTRRIVPHKVFEALAIGLPVITARTPALESLFPVDTTMATCKPGDPQALASLMKTLASNRELRRTLGEEGRRYVRSHYRPSHVASNLLEGIRGVVEASGAWRNIAQAFHPRMSR